MIDKNSDLSIVKQCKLLKLNRSSIYYKAAPVSKENLELMRLIDELHLERPVRGSRTMQDRIVARGFVVNRKRIQRLMRFMGIEAIYPKPKNA